MKCSAYIPCFNNAPTIRATLVSVQAQTIPIDEIFVVDDGSSDGSGKIVEEMGVRVIGHDRNLGRGAVRSRAMAGASHEFVLSCDATNALPPDFLERALPQFADKKVAAVFGRIGQEDNSTAVQRWRGRHLFKMDVQFGVDRQALLITYGLVMRKSHVLSVGNFDSELRHSEDVDLGTRLLANGYEVIGDPHLHVISLAKNTLPEVLERYWRWNAGKDELVSWKGYLKQIVYSVKVMARQDLEAGDIFAVPISLFSPHYQFWRSWILRFRNPNQMRSRNLNQM